MIRVPPMFLSLALSIQKGMRGLGINVVGYNLNHSSDMLLKRIINHFQVRTILDVGANTGQYLEGLVRHGYKGKIYSFEPIPSVFQKLSSQSKKYPNVKAINLGIGSKETEAMINVSENFASSSILNVGKASLEAEPKTRTTHTEKIRITTIDSFFRSNAPLDKEILLKLDIQGYELEALKGALESLPAIKLIQAELSFIRLYDGGPLYDEVITFLTQKGFEIFTIIPGFRNEDSGRMLQADGIFVKSNQA